MNKRINTYEDLIELANGAGRLASQLGVHQCSVEYWRRAGGVPLKHWEKIFDVYGVTPAELYVICKKMKDRIKGRGK